MGKGTVFPKTVGEQYLDFDESKRKYRCCCGKLHIRKGALIAGCVDLALHVVTAAIIFLMLIFRDTFLGESFDVHHAVYAILAIVYLIIVFVIVSMLYGVHKAVGYNVLPYAIVYPVYIILSLVIFSIMIYEFVKRRITGSDSIEPATVVLIVLLVVLHVVRLWFVCVVWRFYFYAKQHKVHKRSVAKFSVQYSTSDTLPAERKTRQLEAEVL